MRKSIDIPDEIVKDLKKMAIDADKDLKNFIQDKLKQLVNKDLIAISELENAWNILLENKGFGYCPNFSDLSKFVRAEKKEQKTSTNIKSKRSSSNGA
jgi:hypothetical protein